MDAIPVRDDPIRHDQDRANQSRRGAASQNCPPGHRRDGKFCSARSDVLSTAWDEFVNKLSGGKPFEEFEKGVLRESIRPHRLIKRFATTEEVANLVTYVCSPLSSATNGAALRVDGGVVKSAF